MVGMGMNIWRGIVTGFLFSLLLVMGALPVSAHTELINSFPQNEETVTEPVDEITLEFGGKILPASTLELLDDQGGSVALEEVFVEDKKLVGIPEGELSNGSYTVNWKIVSEDSHVLEGEFSFNVETPEKDENQSIVSSDENEENNGTNGKVKESGDNKGESSSQQEENVTEDAGNFFSSGWIIGLVVIIVALIAIMLWFGFKRKGSQ